MICETLIVELGDVVEAQFLKSVQDEGTGGRPRFRPRGIQVTDVEDLQVNTILQHESDMVAVEVASIETEIFETRRPSISDIEEGIPKDSGCKATIDDVENVGRDIEAINSGIEEAVSHF